MEMRRSNSTIDLEIGGNSGKDIEVEEPENLGKFRRTGSLNSVEMLKIYDELIPNNDLLRSSRGKSENMVLEVETEKARNLTQDNAMQDQKSKRVAKPPRPPNAQVFDMADMKILREMTEIGKLNRARAQRVKALKKKRRESRSYLSSNILPMIVTLVFFFVVIFEGLLGSRDS